MSHKRNSRDKKIVFETLLVNERGHVFLLSTLEGSASNCILDLKMFCQFRRDAAFGHSQINQIRQDTRVSSGRPTLSLIAPPFQLLPVSLLQSLEQTR